MRVSEFVFRVRVGLAFQDKILVRDPVVNVDMLH